MVYDEIRGEEISGVELLALYGDSDRLGSFLKNVKRFGKKALHYTPHYQAAKAISKLHNKRNLKGEDDRLGLCYGEGDEVVYCTGEDERLAAFLPGLKKAVKKVGKVTSGFTTGIAKAFVPSGVVNALAKFDPTTKGGIKPGVSSLIQTTKPATIKAVVPVPASAASFDMKKIAIIGGSAAAALLVLGFVLRPRR